MPKTTKLMDALTEVEAATDGDAISLGDIVATLNHRGFGALLILPSLLIVLPTGAIPFLPAICSLFMILVCVQMIIGRHHPWMPRRLKSARIERKQYNAAVRTAGPLIRALDSVTNPRLLFLTQPLLQRLVAVICIVLCLVIATVAVIPFAADPFAFAILCFALGLSARDGLVTLLGFAMVGVAFALLPWFLSMEVDTPIFELPAFLDPLQE